jgi:methionine synthase II (cobalamin-independent)
VSFAAGIKGPDGRPLLSSPDLKDALTKGIAIKAVWQAGELARSGKQPILFLDEPYLSGFGSAFSSIERHEVIDMLKEVIGYLRERSDVLIGIHCCGNTDWSMIIDADPDIINFDAFAFMDYFLLYPDAISRFINGGGSIAWGIVPTSDFKGTETVEELRVKLEQGVARLKEIGLDPDLIARRSIITPACGMGTMDEKSSSRVLELLSLLSKEMR